MCFPDIMEDSLSTNNLVRVVVSVLLAVILVGVVMMPIISDMAEDKEVTNTLINTGSPFALANADSESHPIIMSVDGDKLIVTSDGSPVSTGLGNVLPSSIYLANFTGPFNTYYVALNLASGDNEDDDGETRLSKTKGEIAYILNPDNLHQTKDGYTFDPTLYNVMLVIPPVYWYSELDSGSTTNGKLYMASSPDAFVSMGITADKMKDYAHTYTDNGVVGHSPAIMIGVYEGYVYTQGTTQVFSSQSGLTQDNTQHSAQSYSNYAQIATQGVTNGSYVLCNYYMWTLYKMMGWTVMGNTDSQYMMGDGWVGGTDAGLSGGATTGLTDSAYQKANDNKSPVSLFIENPWGSRNEFIGDASTSNGVLIAGNSLHSPLTVSSIVNVLSESVTLPTNSGVYNTFSYSSEVFGTIVSNKTPYDSPGEGINDKVYSNTDSNKNITVGGGSGDKEAAGLSGGYTLRPFTEASTNNVGRLAFFVTDSTYTPISGADDDFAYILSYNINGTIQNVQSIENGVATSYMPTGTTLNEYWNFDTVSDINIPSLSDATNSVDLAVGSDSILQFYNSGNVVLQTATGTVDLGRVNDVTPTPVTVTVQNGVMTYTEADSTVGTVNILLYKANEGDYVYGQNVKLLNDLSQGNVYVGQYQYGVTTANGTKDIGAIGTFTSQTETVGEGEDATEVTTVVPDVALFNTANVSTSTVTSSITQGQYYATINSISIATEFSDSDSVDYTVTGFYAPKTQTYVTITQGGGLAYDILLYLPILILISVITFIGYATLRPDSDFIKSLKSR